MSRTKKMLYLSYSLSKGHWQHVHVTSYLTLIETICLSCATYTTLRYAKRGICRRHVSVCLCLYCIKTAKRRIMQIMPHDSPWTLVDWCQSLQQNSNLITSYGCDKCNWGGLKLATFDGKRAITRKRYKIDAY